MFSITKIRKFTLAASALIIVAGLITAFVCNLNWDVDFTGGTTMNIELGQAPNTSEIAAVAKEATGVAASSVQASEGTAVIIKMPYLTVEQKKDLFEAIKEKYALVDDKRVIVPEVAEGETAPTSYQEFDLNIAQDFSEAEVKALVDEATGVAATVTKDGTTAKVKMESAISASYLDVVNEAIRQAYSPLISQDDVSPSIGNEMKTTALVTSIIAALLMLVYIAFRFEILFAVSAVACLLHDLLIVVAFYAFFRIPVNINFIAAILTVLGYSINATVVIFDRIRENVKTMKRESPDAIADKSIWQTMGRSINTTLTTLIMVVLLLVLGVASIKLFALPLLVGMIAGTYSSIFLAGPIWAWLKKKTTKA
ncbi:MAG: protein translocase subunit SecF [Clostridia bacterium]|nr:protein translocase subunit SecF [Clostridia bacterium]